MKILVVEDEPKTFFRSRPGDVLPWSTVALVALTYATPYLPFVHVFSFGPLPGSLLPTISAITALYIASAEVTKKGFIEVWREGLRSLDV